MCTMYDVQQKQQQPDRFAHSRKQSLQCLHFIFMVMMLMLMMMRTSMKLHLRNRQTDRKNALGLSIHRHLLSALDEHEMLVNIIKQLRVD